MCTSRGTGANQASKRGRMATPTEGFIRGAQRRRNRKEASNAARADTVPRPREERAGRTAGQPMTRTAAVVLPFPLPRKELHRSSVAEGEGGTFRRRSPSQPQILPSALPSPCSAAEQRRPGPRGLPLFRCGVPSSRSATWKRGSRSCPDERRKRAREKPEQPPGRAAADRPLPPALASSTARPRPRPPPPAHRALSPAAPAPPPRRTAPRPRTAPRAKRDGHSIHMQSDGPA